MVCPEVMLLREASIPFLVVGFVVAFLRFLFEAKLTFSMWVRRGGMLVPIQISWEDKINSANIDTSSIQGTAQDASAEGVRGEECPSSLATV